MQPFLRCVVFILIMAKSEQELIHECLAGKRNAFNELYKTYSARLYGICLRFASDQDEAADMLQEAFIRIFEKLYTFQGQGSFEGWIKRITINNSLNYLKKRHLVFESFTGKEELLPAENESFSEDTKPSVENMLKLIQNLPAGYRMVFNLYVFENYTHKQIAETLSISENTSKTQLMRARALLQKKLKEVMAL